MQRQASTPAQTRTSTILQRELCNLVMGLHWDPPEVGATMRPSDLDALCVLFDADGSVLEVINPTHPRSNDGSVIHTGDSRTGTSEWDDERVFVFLDALPMTVSEIAFVVTSPCGRPFSAVRGATCHLSDQWTEHEWIRVDLTLLEGHAPQRIATLRRTSGGWDLHTDARPLEPAPPARAVSDVVGRKGAAGG